MKIQSGFCLLVPVKSTKVAQAHSFNFHHILIQVKTIKYILSLFDTHKSTEGAKAQ